jgi:hypothetical protein
VALQGTIETFALPDVLRLLASTKKTGCLRLDGSRGAGSIWVDSGSIVGGEASGAPHASGADEVLFEMLRFKEGDFVFDADADVQVRHSPTDVDGALDAAEKMLTEWKTIEAVVPTLDHVVTLKSELAEAEVTVSADRWKTIVTIAGGANVGQVGDALELGELPISRNVKELIELGLVEIGEPGTIASATPPPPPAPPAYAEPEPAPVLSLAPEADEVPADDVFDPNALVIEDSSTTADFGAPMDEPAGFGAPAAPPDADPSDAAEIARQLANLSPKAAKAVAAAAKATTPEERERALAEVDDEEDPINRDLLIKFLGSVNS